MKLSAVILTKNEEEMIKDCLESVRFVDEIIIIDANSSDKTREIAQKYTPNIYIYPPPGFADHRNFGLEKSHGQWILYLDADERVTPGLKREVLNLVNSNTDSNGFFVKRDNFYLGKKWPSQDKIQRLFRKEKFIKWLGELHETPQIKGGYGILENPLIHITHRNLSQMLKKTIEWSSIEAKLRFDAHHPKVTWWRLLRVMTTEFWNYYVKQRGFRAGTVGIIESLYQSFSIFITYVKLYELQIKQEEKP
jgi:glycosyltransferase involved in cell wall biosynthesis